MKEFQNITKKQIEQNGVQALSDRPNSVGAYGSGGLSPLELKLAFDRLATLIAEKINEIHKVLAGNEAGQYISVQLQKHGIDNLGALVDTIESGKLADIMQLTPSAGAENKESLQDIIFSLARSLAEAKENLGNIDDIKEALEEIEEIKAAIDNIPQFSEKDPTVPAWAKQPRPPVFNESDPTVPAWAKKENPPTPAEIGAAPAYTYGTKDIEAGTASPHPTGTLHFVFEPQEGASNIPETALVDEYGVALTDADGDYLIPAEAGEGIHQLSFGGEEIDERLTRAGNSILFTEQALTEEQKAQARANIGVILEEDEVTTENVEYTFDGDLETDAYTWVSNTYAKLFVKVADLPDGKINLSGGVVSVVKSDNHWANYNFTITDEMVDETINIDGLDIKAKVSGFEQIFYYHPSTGDHTPMTMVAVCTKPGMYSVALNNWVETLHFSETGVYFMTDINYGGQKYIGSMNCTITIGSEKTEESPVDYTGNEIQVFTRGLCIGDSITEGVFNHSGGQVSIKKYAYPSVLERMTGIDIVNAGISGATSGTWYDASINSTPHWGRWVNNEWVWSESPNVGESDTVSTALDYSGFDFAIIHLGINDIFMMGDATIDETVSSFETNINNIIDKLKTANTGIKVFLCTIIPSYAVPGNANYTAINEKIREIANATEDVFLIDLNEYSECKEGTPYSYIHLTAIGYQKMAAEIKSLISYTIKKNLSKFNMVQFIGTTYAYDSAG